MYFYSPEELDISANFLGKRPIELKSASDEDLKFAYSLVNMLDQGCYDRQTLSDLRERFNAIHPQRRLRNGCLSCMKGQIAYSRSIMSKELSSRNIS